MGLYGDEKEIRRLPIFIVRRISEALGSSGKFFAVIVLPWFCADS